MFFQRGQTYSLDSPLNPLSIVEYRLLLLSRDLPETKHLLRHRLTCQRGEETEPILKVAMTLFLIMKRKKILQMQRQYKVIEDKRVLRFWNCLPPVLFKILLQFNL